MMNKRDLLLLILAAMFLSACASVPKFDTSAVDLGITPQRAVLESESLQSTPVLWGGIIIASTNLKDVTQFEILAYPLGSNQKPDLDEAPLGRFLAQQAGYLETSDYTQGRLITVSGSLHGKSIGKVGESEYTYPVVKTTEHFLWPKRGDSSEPRFHFGIGVMLRN